MTSRQRDCKEVNFTIAVKAARIDFISVCQRQKSIWQNDLTFSFLFQAADFDRPIDDQFKSSRFSGK